MSLECMERKSINDAQTIMHKNKLNKEFTDILGNLSSVGSVGLINDSQCLFLFQRMIISGRLSIRGW